MNRRNFIKSACTVCALGLAGMALPTLLSSCATTEVFEASATAGKIVLPLGIMAERKTRIIRVAQLVNDIALCYSRDGELTALVMQCTHFPNLLVFRGPGFYCSVHGSSFDLAGEVTHGPAKQPLKQLQTMVAGDSIIIKIKETI